MCNTCLVVAVVETVHELDEEVACFFLAEGTCVGDVIEELAALCNLEHNVLTLLLFSTIFHVAVGAVLDLLNDVWMVELGAQAHLGQEQLMDLLILDVIHKFESHLGAGACINCELHLAAGTFSERLDDIVASN